MPLYFFSYSRLSCYILKILLCYISFFLREGNAETEAEARTPHYEKVHFENKTLQKLQVSFSSLAATAQTPPSWEMLLSQTSADGRASFQLTLHLKPWCPTCPPGAPPGLYLVRLMKTMRIWAQLMSFCKDCIREKEKRVSEICYLCSASRYPAILSQFFDLRRKPCSLLLFSPLIASIMSRKIKI